jgi:hypothetical protein
MPINEEENQSTFKNFIRNIEERISALTTLEIKTIIGDYKVNENEQIEQLEGEEQMIMYSKIKLLEGDITAHISNELVQDRYAWVRDFHAQKEEHGHLIIESNIRAIGSLYELYRQSRQMKATMNQPAQPDFWNQPAVPAAGGTNTPQPGLPDPTF